MVGSLTFSFVACGDDDDDNKTTHNQAGINKSLLYGTWRIGEDFEEDNINTYNLLTFSKDGMGYTDFYIVYPDGEEVLDEHTAFTWTLKGNQLSLLADGELGVAIIVSLTKEQMVLTIYYDEEENEYYTDVFTKVK